MPPKDKKAAKKKRKAEAKSLARDAKKPKAAPKTAASASKKPKAAAAQPKKRKAGAEAAQAPSAKKPRGEGRSKPPKPKAAKKEDLADITELAKEALVEIGDGDKAAAAVATKINKILEGREKRQFDHNSLSSFLAPSRYGKSLGVGAKAVVDTYQYAAKSNADILNTSAPNIAIVEERDAKGVPTVFLDLTADYLDRRERQGVPFRAERFAVADYDNDVELTREAARASALAKLALRKHYSKPRHPGLMDDIEDEDLLEKVEAARNALLERKEYERTEYGTGDFKNTRRGLSPKRRRVDGTEYVAFTVKELKGYTYELDPDEDEDEQLDRAAAIAFEASTGHCSLKRLAELAQALEDHKSRLKSKRQLAGGWSRSPLKKKADDDDLPASGPPPPPSPGAMPSQSRARKERVRQKLRAQVPWGPGEAPPPMRKKKGRRSGDHGGARKPALIERLQRRRARPSPSARDDDSSSPSPSPPREQSATTLAPEKRAKDARIDGLLRELMKRVDELNKRGVHLTVLDNDRTGDLNAIEATVFARLDERRGPDDWRTLGFGPIERDRMARDASVRLLPATARQTHGASKKFLTRLTTEHRGLVDVLFGEITSVDFCDAPADAGELIGQAEGSRDLAYGLVGAALENVGDGKDYNYDNLLDEVRRLGDEFGLLREAVQRRVDFKIPENELGDWYVRTWTFDFVLPGWQATAAGLVLRQRALANDWEGMARLHGILRYYGEAVVATASAAVFHRTSLARMSQRGGFGSYGSASDDSTSGSEDASSSDESSDSDSSSSSDDDSSSSSESSEGS